MFRLLFALMFAVTGITANAQDATAPHRIGVRVVDGQGEFYDTVSGERFIPRGVNYVDWLASNNQMLPGRLFDTAAFDRDKIRADFQSLASRGYNTVRIFIDLCSTGPTCIGNVGGTGLNPQYITNIVEVINIAADEGVYLLLTSNDLPDEGGYWEISSRGESEQFAGYRNAHYLTEPGVKAATVYWGDLMEALAAHEVQSEALLAWSILNEQWFFSLQPPLSLRSGTVLTANGNTYDLSDNDQRRAMAVDGVVHYIDLVSTIIREYDPGTLVTMCFFAPKFPNATEIGGDWYVDTAPLLERAALDFFDFHAYPGGDLEVMQFAENFGMNAYPEKPVIMGEVGAFRDRYANARLAGVALQEFIAQSCTAGFDGWLIWDYFGASDAIDDAAWGLQMAEGFLLDALAPLNQPDPCIPGQISLDNLAFGKPVVASAVLPNEPAEHVVDGSTDTNWGAGSHPPQWIEIDLVTPQGVNQVALTVAQFPAGRTVHRVFAILADGTTVLLDELDGVTQDPQILTVTIPGVLNDVQRIRVETIESPSWVSWREVEVYGGNGEAACFIYADVPVNLRTFPSTDAAIGGSIPSRHGLIVGAQTRSGDNVRWWQSLDGAWVRDDVVTAVGDCENVPTIETP